MVKIKEGVLKKTELDSTEKGIVRLLGSAEDDAVNLDELKTMLNKAGYEVENVSDLRQDLDHLIDVGYVRSKTYGKGSDREEKFRLTNYVVGGTRRKIEEQGRGVIPSTAKMYKRWFGKVSGAFFLLIGLGVFIYEGIGMTGAVISSSERVTPAFILGFALFVIGVTVLEKSYKQEREDKKK